MKRQTKREFMRELELTLRFFHPSPSATTLLNIWRELEELRYKNQEHLITIRGLQDTIHGLEKINEKLHQAAERSITNDRPTKSARRVANGMGSKVAHGQRVSSGNLRPTQQNRKLPAAN